LKNNVFERASVSKKRMVKECQSAKQLSLKDWLTRLNTPLGVYSNVIIRNRLGCDF